MAPYAAKYNFITPERPRSTIQRIYLLFVQQTTESFAFSPLFV
jgi:hypothetical protein